MSFKTLTAATALAALLLAAGCGKGSFSKRNQGAPDTLRYGMMTNASTIDPGQVQDIYSYETLNNVFEGLVRYNADNKIEPCLAESWETIDDGKTYVFHLRHGVKFQNGRELSAADFKWSIDRNTDPKFNSSTAPTYLNDIVGYAERVAGKSPTVTGVEVVDPYTLRIRITAPRAYFIEKLTYPCSFAMARDVSPLRELHAPSEAVGTGPFKLTAFVADQKVELEAFDGYWGGKPLVRKIQRDVILDSAVRVNKFRSGEIDVVEISRNDIPAAKTDPDLSPFYRLVPQPNIQYAGLNGNIYKPFANRDVRRAVAMAIDRMRIDSVLLSSVKFANEILPPGIPGYDPEYKGIPYDPVVAKQLLRKAGYPNGDGMPPLELDYLESTPENRITCEEIATELKDALGIQVHPRGMEIRTFQTALDKRQIGFYVYGWIADYLDPQDFLSLLMHTGSSANAMSYSNPLFDQVCDQADVEPDPDIRLAGYRKAQDIAVQDVAWIPIYFGNRPYLLSARVQNFPFNLFGSMPLGTVNVR